MNRQCYGRTLEFGFEFFHLNPFSGRDFNKGEGKREKDLIRNCVWLPTKFGPVDKELTRIEVLGSIPSTDVNTWLVDDM